MKTKTTKAAREAAIAEAATAFVFHPENQARAMIRTRYLQPTGSRSERVKAYARSGRRGEPSIVLPWSYDLDSQGNHARAAAALALSLGWVKEGGRKVLCGGNGDDGTAAFVIIDTAAAAPAGQRNDAKGGWAV